MTGINMLLKIYQCYKHRAQLYKIGVNYLHCSAQLKADQENEECPYCKTDAQTLKIIQLESKLHDALANPKLI